MEIKLRVSLNFIKLDGKCAQSNYIMIIINLNYGPDAE